MPRGRTDKLTPARQQALVERIKAGAPYETATKSIGIGYTTFRRWMLRGEAAESGRFRDFYEAITQAEHECEVRMIAQWQGQMPKDWRAIRDFLERRFPDRWGKRVSHGFDPSQPLKVQMTREEQLQGLASLIEEIEKEQYVEH